MTWRSDGTTSALTLLVGSDPLRAPSSLNQWGADGSMLTRTRAICANAAH